MTHQSDIHKNEIAAIDELPDGKPSRDKRLGHEIAYGIRQTLACWATDFIDPPISKFLQNRFGDKSKPVGNKEVWGGEIAGDSLAFFIYMGFKRLLTRPVDAVIAKTQSLLDKRLAKSGKEALKPWADHHHYAQDDPRYQRKLEAYKHYQAEGIVDSNIIGWGACLSNVVLQKEMFGNEQRYRVILGSKVVGTAATLLLMLGLAKATPVTMETLDNELDDRYFSHAIRGTKRMAGIKGDAPPAQPAPRAKTRRERLEKYGPAPLIEVAAGSTLTALGAQKLANWNEELVHMLPKSVALGAVATMTAAGLRWLVPDTIKTFNHEVREHYTGKIARKVARETGAPTARETGKWQESVAATPENGPTISA